MKRSLILLALVALTAGCQNTARRTDTLKAPLSAGQTLSAHTEFGSITVQGDTGNECQVTARIFAQAPTLREAKEILTQSQAKLVPTDAGLDMFIEHPKLPENRCVGGDLLIQLPNVCGLNGQTDYGKIKIQQVHGGVKAYTDFGRIDCDGIAGPVDLKTDFGKIKVHQVESQNLSIDSDFGDLLLVYSGDTPNPLTGTLHTDFGHIKIYLPELFSGHIEGKTDFGSVSSSRPLQVQGHLNKDNLTGRIGAGNSHLTATTDFGSIRIH